MSGSNQFYADNEKKSEIHESEIDLSIAYEIKPNALSEEEWENQNVVFFCHDCGKLVNATSHKTKKGMKFSCSECNGKRISFGTLKSLQNFFHLNDDGVRKE